MACATLPAVVGGVILTPAQLASVREAFVARVDIAADRAVRRAEIAPGMPASLAAASCWLAAHGVAAATCMGEETFRWNLATSRVYLDGLDPAAITQEMDAGHDALFGGRHPIARGILDLARDLTVAGERLATAEIVTLRTADELRARWNSNAARFAAVEKEAA